MWHNVEVSPAERVLEVLAGMPALRKVTFVVQTQARAGPAGGAPGRACTVLARSPAWRATLRWLSPVSADCQLPLINNNTMSGASRRVWPARPDARMRLCPAAALQRDEAPSVEVAALMLGLPRRRPSLELAALDSEQFYGITIADLDGMAAEEGATVAGAAGGAAGAPGGRQAADAGGG